MAGERVVWGIGAPGGEASKGAAGMLVAEPFGVVQ